jgi:hypothetical protein
MNHDMTALAQQEPRSARLTHRFYDMIKLTPFEGSPQWRLIHILRCSADSGGFFCWSTTRVFLGIPGRSILVPEVLGVKHVPLRDLDMAGIKKFLHRPTTPDSTAPSFM